MKPVPTPAAEKLKMMQASICCLVFGFLALVPIIGVPFGLAALWSSFGGRKLEKLFWNPAKFHRRIGLVCAAVGLLVWCLVDTVLIYNCVNGRPIFGGTESDGY